MQRKTLQRAAIEAVFMQDGPISIEDILREGRKHVASLNQATVYRNLKHLVQQKRIRQISHPIHGTAYERVVSDHHHHFLCRVCQRTFDIPGCALRADYHLPEGYVVEDHEIYLYGLCSGCTDNP